MRLEIENAALDVAVDAGLFDESLSVRSAARVIRAFLVKLKARASGWKFWQRYALSVVIGILDELVGGTDV